MDNVDLLFKKIDSGKEGGNIGLKTGLDKLDKYTGGMQKGVYTLIYGLSGSGKSSLVLYSYIYRPLRDYPDKDIKYIYFSLEMSSEVLLAKLLCLWLYDEYKIVVSYSEIMSWTKRLSDDLYEKVLSGKSWLKSISNKLIILDQALSANLYYSKILNFLSEWGRFEESADKRRKIYIKNNPEQIVNVVVDHIGLCMPIEGRTKKQEIDLISAYSVTLRERCGVSFYILQQENRNSASSEKIKADMTDCSLDGLKDSGNTGNDAEICIGVYCPLKFKIKTKSGYPIICEDNGDGFIGFRDRIRFLQIVKNRFGESDRSIASLFYGELGLFEELDKPENIKNPVLYQSLLTKPPKTDHVITNEIEQNIQNEPKKLTFKL